MSSGPQRILVMEPGKALLIESILELALVDLEAGHPVFMMSRY